MTQDRESLARTMPVWALDRTRYRPQKVDSGLWLPG